MLGGEEKGVEGAQVIPPACCSVSPIVPCSALLGNGTAECMVTCILHDEGLAQ